MGGDTLRSPAERPLFIVGVIVSTSVWLGLVVTVVGITYALMAMGFLLVGRALLLARVRGDGVRLSPSQMPELHACCEEAAARVGLRAAPPVYVLQEGGALRSLALRLLGRDVVVLSSALVEKCATRERLMFVVGHELGHLAEGHLAWRLFLAPFRVVPWLGPAYARACELTCDAYGAAAARDVTESKRAILLQACGHVHGDVDPFVYAAQRRETEDFWAGVYEVVSEHPYATQRVARLDGTPTAAPARHPLATALGPLAGIGAGTPASAALLVGLYVGVSFAFAGPLGAWTRALQPPAAPPPAPEASAEPPPAPAFPRVPRVGPRGPYTVMERATRVFDGDVVRQEYALVRPTGLTRVWVYRPPGRGYPVVLVPPAGGRAISAAYLTENDAPEHLPWARAGFMVVSHDLDGPSPGDDADEAAWWDAAAAFRAADGGLVNMREALDVALARSPDADPSRVAVAGHSSAGAQALVFAAQDARVKLCAAFMPPADYAARTPRATRDAFRPAVPDIDDFLRAESPATHAASVRVPVFLAAADDDTNVRADEVDGLRRALVDAGARVEFLRLPRGGHYGAMVNAALPAAVAWAGRAFHLRHRR
ncbi:MAG: M48 family metalloprotease [Polyangiales bacterium]